MSATVTRGNKRECGDVGNVDIHLEDSKIRLAHVKMLVL